MTARRRRSDGWLHTPASHGANCARSCEPLMSAEEWFDKRRALADQVGRCAPVEVPAEAVWYLIHPQPPLTDDDRARAREIAGRFDVGIDFCHVHGGIMNAGDPEHRCDKWDGGGSVCILRPLAPSTPEAPQP